MRTREEIAKHQNLLTTQATSQEAVIGATLTFILEVLLDIRDLLTKSQ